MKRTVGVRIRIKCIVERNEKEKRNEESLTNDLKNYRRKIPI